MYCTSCGQSVHADARFCRRCGAPLDVTANGDVPSGSHAADAPPHIRRKFDGNTREIQPDQFFIKPYLWIGLFIIGVIAAMMFRNIGAKESIGFNAGGLIVGLILSILWWGISRILGHRAWRWYDWLNSAMFTNLAIIALSALGESYMKSRYGM